MKRCLAGIFLFSMTGFGQVAPFLIGTYQGTGKDSGIFSARLDLKTGQLDGIAAVAAAPNSGFLAASDDGRFLFAVGEDATGVVRSYKIGGNEELELLNERPSGGSGACHVWFGAGHVFVSNYGSGSVACFPVSADGQLGPATAEIAFKGSGPNPSRQKAPHAHAMATSADGRFAYACDLGTDSVWSFAFDRTTGKMTPTEPPRGSVAPGGGPRHLVIPPEKPFLYANDEMGIAVSVFSRDPADGTLNLLQTIPTLPEGTPREGVSTAAIALHPSGRWLYVSNRGDDSITVFEIGGDGRLRWVETVASTVRVPRGFSLDPSGDWLVIAGQKDGALVSMRVNGENGKLTPVGRLETNTIPVCITFAHPSR
ncbi:MAG: lactonase family protein [Terrimicrobiaceae bacterium]|jgi:6-phosphogluconolactonase